MGASSAESKVPILRQAHPLAFAAFLDHIGAPFERYFRQAGLPVCCERADEFVPVRNAWSFFDAAARREDPLLGWHAGRLVGDRNLNEGLLRRLETSPTLYLALRKLIRLVSAEASHLELGVLERGDNALICTQYPDMKGVPGYSHSQAYQLEIFLGLIRHFLGRHWVPDRIGVEHPIATKALKDHLPGTRVLTHQRVGYVVVPRRSLHMAAIRSDVEAENDSLVLTKDLDHVGTLRALLRAYVGDGYTSAQKAASLMGTSVRTLARRLSAHDLTYGALVDQVRFDLARDMLADTDAKVVDVAGSVGFGDPAHFARMFRRIAGLSPSEFRAAVQLDRAEQRPSGPPRRQAPPRPDPTSLLAAQGSPGRRPRPSSRA